jgi:hypothetical protein
MAKDLDIRLRMDRSQAERSSQEFHQGERQRIAQLLTAEQVQAAARQQIIARTNSERVTAAVRAIQGERQELAKALTQEEALHQARNNLINRANQQRVAATERALRREQEGWLETSGVMDKAVGILTSFAGQMMGINALSAVAGAIADEFNRMRESIYSAAAMVTDYRKALLELAALKGQPGETTKTLAEDIKFRRATLLDADAARRFQTAALGAGESAIDLPEAPGGRKVTRDEFTKAMTLSASFAAVEHGDAGVYGSLIGTLANVTRGRTTGEDLFARQQHLYEIFKPGAFEFSQAASEFAGLTPLIAGGTYDETTAGALLSMFSRIAPQGSGISPATLVQQFTRGTLGGIGRQTGPKIEGAEKQGAYLGGLGITLESVKDIPEGELPVTIGTRIAQDIARARAETQAKGQTFEPVTYMMQHGFAEEQVRNALIAFEGQYRAGDVKTFLDLAKPGARPDPEAVRRQIATRARIDPALQEMALNVAEQEAGIAVGTGEPEYIGKLSKLAYLRRKARGEESYKTFEEFRGATEGLSYSSIMDDLVFGRGRANRMEMQGLLAGEAERVGVPFRTPQMVDPRTGARRETYVGDEALYEVAQQIAVKGGQMLPGLEQTGQLADRQLEVVQKFDNAVTRFEAANGPKDPPLTAANRTNPRTGMPE